MSEWTEKLPPHPFRWTGSDVCCGQRFIVEDDPEPDMAKWPHTICGASPQDAVHTTRWVENRRAAYTKTRDWAEAKLRELDEARP